MQHQPDALIFIEAYLDEMITASKSPDLPPDPTFVKLPKPRTNRQPIKARVKLLDLSIKLERLEAGAIVHLRRRLVKVETHRHVSLDLRSYSRQILGKIRGREVQLHGNHSAADVDSNSRRN